MNAKMLLIAIGSTIFAGCHSPSVSNPQAIKSAYAPVSSAYIENLQERIADLPKAESMPIAKLLSHLGLWKYRKEMEIGGKTNISVLALNERGTETITFISDEHINITREKIENFVNWWELGIKNLHIHSIIFRGVITDLN